MDNLTLRDRCVFGAIAAFGGLVVGGIVCLVLFYEHPQQPFNRALLFFSVAYFFFAGFFLGARAADLLGGAMQVGVQRAEYELNPLAAPTPPPRTVPSDATTAVVTVGYVLGAIALAYLA